MLIKTSRKPITVTKIEKDTQVPISFYDTLDAKEKIACVIDWTGAMRVIAKSGVLQQNIIRFVPIIKRISITDKLPFYLCTHKITELAHISKEWSKLQVTECLQNTTATPSLAYKAEMFKQLHNIDVFILFSDGHYSDNRTFRMDLVEKHFNKFLLIVNLNQRAELSLNNLEAFDNVCVVQAWNPNAQWANEEIKHFVESYTNWSQWRDDNA